MVLNGKSSQEYPVNAGVPQAFALGGTLCLLYINDVTSNVIFNITIYANDTNLYSKWSASDSICIQLELNLFQLELEYTVDWARNDVLISVLKKTQLVPFDWLNNCSAIDLKMNGPNL